MLRSDASCARFTDGSKCRLIGANPFYRGNGTVRVNVRNNTVKFTVISTGYFDRPGGTIKFHVYKTKGAVYLSQIANGQGRIRAVDWFGPLGASIAWNQQANNYRALLRQQRLYL